MSNVTLSEHDNHFLIPLKLRTISHMITLHFYDKGNAKLDSSLCLQKLRLPDFLDYQHMKVVRLSALHTGCFYALADTPCIPFCLRLSRLWGHSATRRIKSTKKYSDTIGKRTCDLTACSAVPQPLHTPF